jgi:hypothetical protein
MDNKQLRIYIKKSIQEVFEEVLNENKPQTSPSGPETSPGVLEPGTKEPIKPKRRTLRPGKDAPDSTPAKALMKENEKEILKKIAQRFKNLK